MFGGSSPPLREALPELQRPRRHQRERPPPAPGEAHTNQYPVINRQPNDGPAGEGRGGRQPRPRTHPPGRRLAGGSGEAGDGGAWGASRGSGEGRGQRRERKGRRRGGEGEGKGQGQPRERERCGSTASAITLTPSARRGEGVGAGGGGGQETGGRGCRGARRGAGGSGAPAPRGAQRGKPQRASAGPDRRTRLIIPRRRPWRGPRGAAPASRRRLPPPLLGRAAPLPAAASLGWCPLGCGMEAA